MLFTVRQRGASGVARKIARKHGVTDDEFKLRLIRDHVESVDKNGVPVTRAGYVEDVKFLLSVIDNKL
jgi:hypothetical protein